MDGNPIHFVKEHPYAVAGVVFVIGAFILYEYYSPGSGGSGTAVVATRADNSGLAAAVQLSGQQTALTAQNNQLATQLQALQISTDAQTAQKTAEIQGQIDLAKIQSDAQKQLSADQLTATLSEYQSQSTIQALGITAQKDIADTAAATQLAALQTQAAEQESISQSAAATQVGLAALSASIQAKQIDAASAAHTQDVNLQAMGIQSVDYRAGLAANVATEQVNLQSQQLTDQYNYAVQSLPYQQDALARVINYNETIAGWNEQLAQYGIVYGNQTAQVLGQDAVAQAQANAAATVGVANANASAAAGNTTGGILSGAGSALGGLGGLVKAVGALF